MALTLSGTNGVVGAGFTLDASGASVTAGVGTFSSVQGEIPAASIVGVCTAGLTRTGGFGKFASYAIITDQKSSETDAGGSTGGTWHTRDLNTELADPDGIVSISSNQFTLQAGSYFLEASAPSYQASRHKLKLYQTSGTPADIAFGSNSFANSGIAIQSFALLSCRFTISSATTYEIRHYIQSTKSGNGLGVAVNDGSTENYCLVKIFKES